MGETEVPGRQAPPGAWSPEMLKDALTRGTHEEKLALLREIGLVGPDGSVPARYKNWGTNVSRAEDEGSEDQGVVASSVNPPGATDPPVGGR